MANNIDIEKSRTKSHDVAERLRLVVESVRDYAIFMLDPDGRVATWNPGAELAKGYRADEIIGHHIEIFYTPQDREAGLPRQLLGAAVRDGRVENEGWRQRKDGTRFWADVVITALRDPDGGLAGFAKVTRDLTERRLADEERIKLARAEEAVRLRDEFLSIASHELKTPLTALKLQLDSLKSRLNAPDERACRAVDRVVRSADRLHQLVESLFDVSRISAGRLTLSRRELDLGDVLKNHLEGLREAAERAGCSLAVTTVAGIRGCWDQVRLEQVVTNVFENATKYGAGTPLSVSLELDLPSAEAVIEVADRGPGIPEGDLVRIFERFERAVPSRHFGGLGLGLYVSRRIVEAHGGSITASNRSGGGSCFTIRLPVRPAAGLPASVGGVTS
jgi:PAS domain S-box-containing protein